MNTPFRRSLTLLTTVAALCIASGPPAPRPARAATGPISTNTPPPNIAEELRRFREEIEAQGRRIDRLYRALGPQLEEMEAQSIRLRRREEEDTLLAMQRVADISGENLRSQGCASPTAAEFAVITRGGGVQIFDPQGNPKKKLRPPGQIITAVAFSPKSSELLTGTDAGALLVWDVAKGTYLTVSTNIDVGIRRVAWVGNNKLAWGSHVNYWEQGGKAINHDKPAGAVLDRESGKVLWRFKANVLDDYVTLAGAPDGSCLGVIEIPGQPRGAFLLNGASGVVLKTCYDKEHGSGPLSVGISPDGKMLAVGYGPWDILLWDASTGEKRKLLKGHENWVVSLAFSADSRRLISGGGDSTARVWDAGTGQEIGRLRFKGDSTYVHSVGFSPSGDLAFALTEQGQLVVARVPTNEQ